MTKSTAYAKGTAQGVLDGRFTTIKSAGKDPDAIASKQLYPEDVFSGIYSDTLLASNGIAILEPSYVPAKLLHLILHNDALQQCILAMEVNVAGTGFSFTPADKNSKKLPEKETKDLVSFFGECYPKTSYTTELRKVVRDQESTGNGYLEVVRNIKRDIVLFRHIPAINMRLCRLGAPKVEDIILLRGGKEVSIRMAVRHRRFAQRISTTITYFKEFGAVTELDSLSGRWDKSTMVEGEASYKVDTKNRATEIIHFKCIDDIYTPYGVPRWIPQVLSIVGSRQAEEHNISFFDSGGLPPVLVTVAGGTLATETKAALESYLNSSGGNQHRAAILEAFASGSTTDGGGSVKITVERFGSERVSDSMFENYDKRCEERVRAAFRLPPIFVGQAKDYNFATAQAAYRVAENQVFAPERRIIDELITSTIVRGLGHPAAKIISNAIRTENPDDQMKGVDSVKGKVSDSDHVAAVNKIVGLNLEVDKQKIAEGKVQADAQAAAQAAALSGGNAPPGVKSPEKGAPIPKTVAKKFDQMSELLALADDWSLVLNNTTQKDEGAVQKLHEVVKALQGANRVTFYTRVARNVYPQMHLDPAGAIDMVVTLTDMVCDCDSHGDI